MDEQLPSESDPEPTRAAVQCPCGSILSLSHSAGHTLAGGQSFPVFPEAPPQGLSRLPATLLQAHGPHFLSALPGSRGGSVTLLTSFKRSTSFNHHRGLSVCQMEPGWFCSLDLNCCSCEHLT